MMRNIFFSIKIKSNKGQSTLEFAMIIPFILLVVFAVSQIAYIVYIQNKLTQAAREGVRVLCVTNSNNRMEEQISKALWGLDESKVIIESNSSIESDRRIGDSVEVTVCYAYPGFLGLADTFLKEGLKIKAKASMMMECN
jgi:uncharacterized protein (UPF0333 family)